MKLSRIVMMVLFGMGCLQMVAAEKPDTIWLCRDTAVEQYFMKVMCADTFPDNRGPFDLVDTGDALDGMYVNFDYQFGNPHPGYAGFKYYWDNGIASFWIAEYDSMVFWHKGPLPGHKVKMIWAQGSAGCGTPINYQDYFEFKSSAEWKREAFPFPEGFVKKGLFELRMLIYNDTETSETSPPGCLKIDNMYFYKNPTAVRPSIIAPVTVSDANHFIPKISSKVTLTIFSLQGEQLFKEPVDVTAGKTYNVMKFAQKNSKLPVKWVQCVHILGAGVNVTKKVMY